jgi:hypothetical protein
MLIHSENNRINMYVISAHQTRAKNSDECDEIYFGVSLSTPRNKGGGIHLLLLCSCLWRSKRAEKVGALMELL